MSAIASEIGGKQQLNWRAGNDWPSLFQLKSPTGYSGSNRESLVVLLPKLRRRHTKLLTEVPGEVAAAGIADLGGHAIEGNAADLQ